MQQGERLGSKHTVTVNTPKSASDLKKWLDEKVWSKVKDYGPAAIKMFLIGAVILSVLGGHPASAMTIPTGIVGFFRASRESWGRTQRDLPHVNFLDYMVLARRRRDDVDFGHGQIRLAGIPRPCLARCALDIAKDFWPHDPLPHALA